jgi:hypothetical protein
MERNPGTHCTGSWVGPEAGLDMEATEKILLPLPGIEPRSPGIAARSQTLYRLSYTADLGIWHRVVMYKFNDVSEVLNASIRAVCYHGGICRKVVIFNCTLFQTSSSKSLCAYTRST